jgi:hypothetical protein
MPRPTQNNLTFIMATISVDALVRRFAREGTEAYFHHWVRGDCGLLVDARKAWQTYQKSRSRRSKINDFCTRLVNVGTKLETWSAPLTSRQMLLRALVAKTAQECTLLLQQAFEELANSAWQFQIPEELKERLYLRTAGQSQTRLTNTSAYRRLDKDLLICKPLLTLSETHGWIHPAVLLLTETCAWVTGKTIPEVAGRDRRRVPISLVEDGEEGETQGRLAWLTVERISGGTGALSPHPLRQAHFVTQGPTGSGHFLESLLRAWWRTVGYDLAQGRDVDFDLWWSIESRDPGPQGQTWRPNLAGFSADVAIANALRALRDGVAVDGRIVVSASFESSTVEARFPSVVDPREPIWPVTRLGDKLSRARLAAGETAPEVTEFVTSIDSPWFQPAPKGGDLDGDIQTIDTDRKERSFGNGLTLIGVRQLDQQWEIVNTGAQITRQVKDHLQRRAEILLKTECGHFVEPKLLVWDPVGGFDRHQERKHRQQRIQGEVVKRLLRGEISGGGRPIRGARLAIRGDSGLGKSILMVWAELLLARDAGPIIPLRLGAGPKTTPQPGLSGQAIPGWQMIFRWDPGLQGQARIDSVEGLIFDWLMGPLLVDAGVQASEETRRRWFQEKLRSGEIAWLMDALDQAGDSPEQRMQTLLGEPWHRCAAVLTTRLELSDAQKTAYVETSTQAQWREVDIVPFDEAQIHEFLELDEVRQKLLIEDGDDEEETRRKRQWQDLLTFPILARQLKDLARSQARGPQKSLEQLRNREAVYYATLGELLERGKNSLTNAEKSRYRAQLTRTSEIPSRLQEAAWLSLKSEVSHTVSGFHGGFDGELRAQAHDGLQTWLEQTGFPQELLRKINLLEFYEEAIETLDGQDKSYARWRHKSFGEWFAGLHLVESPQARQQLPNLLQDPRWRDTVRYALSAAARLNRRSVLQELVAILIRVGRVFWVWEALSDDALAAQTAGSAVSTIATLDPAWETLCRWLVHRDWDGREAWEETCPLPTVWATCDVWASLFDRQVRDGRVLSAAWELVKQGRNSENSRVAEASNEIYRKFLSEWPTLLAGNDPVTGLALDPTAKSLVQDLAWQRDRDVAEVTRDEPVTHVRYCRIPPQGNTYTYEMGSPAVEPGRYNNEQERQVTIPAYWLRSFPMTNAEYELFDPGHRKRRTESSAENDQPVVNLSWWECQLLCEWLGGVYRLPTEEEWEAACRAGTQTAYWYGPDANELPRHAWFKGNSDGRTHTLKESLKKGQHTGEGHVNPWGLVDMHGNIWEWCGLRDDASLGLPCPNRGCSWRIEAGQCRSAIRSESVPESRGGGLGLRLVASPSDAEREPQPDAQVRTRSGGSP